MSSPAGGARRSVFIGRKVELQTWRDRVADLHGGHGSVLVVTGEAGIGKSRFVEECLRAAGEVYTTVGTSPPVAGTELPYAPILQALRDLGRGLAAAEWARMAADWPAELKPLLAPSPAGPAAAAQPKLVAVPDLPVSRTAQVRFFETLLRGLVGLARDRPVVLAVEDLHWADRSTLDLLAFLAANIPAERVLLLLTARTDIDRQHPLRPWLAEVCRVPHSVSVELTRLTLGETADLLTGLLHEAPATDLVDRVFLRADGNPLFTEVLLPESRGGRESLPPMLRDLLTARFAELSDSGQQLLRVASVAGRRVPDELLEKLITEPALGPGAGSLDATLRELVDRQILRPAADGRAFEFRHELFREAAYGEVLPGERRRLHRALAEVLTRRPDLSSGGPGEIAHHYTVAGDWSQALPAAVEAGLLAEQACAFAEALAHFQAALDMWERLPEPGDHSPLPRHALLARAAQTADLVGDCPLAVDLVERALAAADPADLPVVALLHERRGTYHFNAGHADEARTAFRTALERLPVEPSAERARVLASLALLEMAWTRLADAASAAQESIQLAQTVGAPREEGRARNALGVVKAYAGDFDAGVEQLRMAVQLARGTADADDHAAASINLGHVLGVAGRYEEAVAASLEGHEAARQVGLEGEHGSFLLANAAECLIRAGRWSQADRLLGSATARKPRGFRAFPVLMQVAWLALRRGAYDEAAERISAVRTMLDDGGGGPSGWRRELLEATADLAAWQGRTGEVTAAVEEALRLAEDADEERFAGPLVVSGLRAAADDAERSRAGREPAATAAAEQRGARLWARALALRPCPVLAGGGVLPEVDAIAAACAGELGRLAGTPDASAWARSADGWRSLGRPYDEAYSRWREADARFPLGEEAEAVTALRAAYALAVRLPAAGLVEEISALAGWRRVPLEVVEVAPVSTVGDRLGLTPREWEVLARVTAGQSNGQIAEALFISVKTASVHVSNILRKLAVPRREDAARIGRQFGLGGTAPPMG